MSYNRGNRRDSGGRRSGDFGGGNSGSRRGGNYRSNYDSYMSNQVNPWEGGLPPGGNRGGAGLLPSPNQPDLLSQLSSTEAQLAIASNLINKIFNQPQQSLQPPSLLSLGGLGSGGGPMSGYGNDYEARFQERRRARMDNQRRSEPYNKSALNRRMGSDRRNLGRNRNSSDRKTVPKSKKDDKDSKKDKDGEKTNGEVDKPESTDEKRESDKKDGSISSEDKRSKGSKYQNIPAALLYCHICSKNMWDELSFTKHLKGRPHQIMMDGLNDKYKLKVELLRHELRVAEQQREMELDRKHRQGMKMYNQTREYCAMCDLHFYGNLISHRKNVRHQKLKAFLHPKCSHCNKEFSTRLEWDEHRLSSPHLRKVADYRRATKPEIKDDEFDIDELVNPESINEGEMVNKDIEVVTRQQSEEDLIEVKEDAKDKAEEETSKEGEEGAEETTPKGEEKSYNSIDLDPSKLPKYSPTLSVGQDLIKQISGYLCRGCKKFMPGEEDYKVHCRTMNHFNNYCNLVRAKARVSARKRREDQAKERVEKVGKEEDGKDKADEKDKTVAGDDEGNWKRRKCTKDGEEEEDGEGTQEKMEVDEDQGEKPTIKSEPTENADVWKEIDNIIEDEGEEKQEEEKPDEEKPDEEKSQAEENDEEEEKEETTVATKTKNKATRGRGGKAKRGGK